MLTKATIADQWKMFENQVIHKDAPTIQRREMCIAFYAGFQSALGLLLHVIPDLTEEDAHVLLDKLLDEVHKFPFEISEAGHA